MCILSFLSIWLLKTSLWPALVQEWPHSPARSRRKHPRAAGRPWGCDLAETQLGRARDRSQTRGCWEKLRCLAWDICWQRATRRQGIIHGACFSLSYPEKSVLIALGHQHRLVSSCTREQDFHSYPWPHLLGCGPRWEAQSKKATDRLNPEWSWAGDDCLRSGDMRNVPTPLGFPDSSVGKESACNAGDPGSIPGSGRSAGEGIGYPL